MLCSSRFVKDNQHLVKLFQCCVTLCTNHLGSATEQGGERERCALTYRESVFVCLCYQLSRRVAGCLRFWTKLSGFSGSGFSPLLMALAAICQHVSSQVQLQLVWVKIHPLYGLQGSSLKTWVNFHPRPRHIKLCTFFIISNFSFSQTYIIFCKNKGKK